VNSSTATNDAFSSGIETGLLIFDDDLGVLREVEKLDFEFREMELRGWWKMGCGLI